VLRLNKKNFLDKICERFPDFAITLGDAKYADGESIFVDGDSIEIAWHPSLDKWDSQSLELLYPDCEKHVQETSYKLAKESRQT
tara:strand:- start:44 stop:295 length:252 start_codon:yes stop_codon:yes gene_type:complete